MLLPRLDMLTVLCGLAMFSSLLTEVHPISSSSTKNRYSLSLVFCCCFSFSCSYYKNSIIFQPLKISEVLYTLMDNASVMTAIKVEDYRDSIWNLQLLKIFMVSLCTLDTHPHQKRPSNETSVFFQGFKLQGVRLHDVYECCEIH